MWHGCQTWRELLMAERSERGGGAGGGEGVRRVITPVLFSSFLLLLPCLYSFLPSSSRHRPRRRCSSPTCNDDSLLCSRRRHKDGERERLLAADFSRRLFSPQNQYRYPEGRHSRATKGVLQIACRKRRFLKDKARINIINEQGIGTTRALASCTCC